MERGEYEALQAQVLLMAAMLNRLPLAEFVAAIDKAQAVGPMLDPTLYRAAADNLQYVEDVARALLEAKTAILESYEGHPQIRVLREVGVVGAAGLEPATTRLEGGCSDPPELRPDSDHSNAVPSRAPGFYPRRRTDAHLGAVEQANGCPDVEGSPV